MVPAPSTAAWLIMAGKTEERPADGEEARSMGGAELMLIFLSLTLRFPLAGAKILSVNKE
jgi:hypothetical protein